MTAFFLPYPPSVNNMFANRKRGRRKTDEYIAWLKEAKADLDAQKYYDGFNWSNHKGMVNVILMFKAPDKRIRDVDNLLKPVLDFLVTHEVIVADDSRYVQTVHAGWWNNTMKNVGCFVVIEDAGVSK